jgi:uncharacterized UPF0160 family protein
MPKDICRYINSLGPTTSGVFIMDIQTHDGLFHADEVFACAFIKYVYPYEPIRIFRTRDTNIKDIDLYIDVGGKFDGNTYFDHHFREFNELHYNGIPKSSFGLIFDEYSHLLEMDEKIINRIRNTIVIPIDAHDNNVQCYKNNDSNYIPYTVSNIISSFNEEVNNDYAFDRAVYFANTILTKLIDNIVKQFRDEDEVRMILDSNDINQPYIIFNKYYNYNNVIKDNKYSYLTHIIFPEKDNYKAVCLKDKNNKLKAPFPSNWGGLMDDDLIKESGIPGSVFCHKGLWIAVNKTINGIIKMVEYCHK